MPRAMWIDSTLTNVGPSILLSVLKTPFSLNPSSFIFQPSSFILQLLSISACCYIKETGTIDMNILFHFRKNICLNRICVIFEYFLIINMDREVPEKAPEDHHHLAMAISNPESSS